LVVAAIEHYEANTSLKFVLQTEVKNYIEFMKGKDVEIDVVDLASAHVSKEPGKYEVIKNAVIEQVKELLLSINIVRKEKAFRSIFPYPE
jgi:phage terminase small subunit